MVVLDGEHFGAPLLEPSRFGQALALRTVPVSARIVGDDLVRAVVALLDMAAQYRRAAVLDCPHGFELLGRHRGAMSCAVPFAVLTKDIGHLQLRLGHVRAEAVSARAESPGDCAFSRRRRWPHVCSAPCSRCSGDRAEVVSSAGRCWTRAYGWRSRGARNGA